VPSTVATERATNPFLRVDTPAVRAALAAAWPGRALDGAVARFAALRELKDSKAYRAQPEPLQG